MTGISEVLVLLLLITCVLILPRMLKPAPKNVRTKPGIKGFSMKMRAGVVASVVFPILTALLMKPWQVNPTPYIFTGILPVVVCWGIVWILAARKK
ncbi:MAG: hypothetical protein HUK40_19475 [Desulfobacter sp.]|nr:hypothetical protein [Desulfobacter sp.]WDP86174.1 MAG: hypothetical protein HUN05_14430 [Desulfobacter sp.]